MTQSTNRKHPSIRTLRRRLKAIAEEKPAGIRAEVAEYALNYSTEDPADFFRDLMQCGCQSGIIGGLVHYTDTHVFFDRHYDEIEELREDMEDSLGEPLRIKDDLKNWLAWFGFEETAYRMAVEELGLEI